MFEERRQCWKRENGDGRERGRGQKWKREDSVERGGQCSKEDSGARGKLTKRNKVSKMYWRDPGEYERRE